MYEFLRDLQSAVRRFAKTPGFTVLAVVTLGLGIGASTATYSLVKAVLLRPLPFREPERLVWISNTMHGDTLSHRTSRVDAFLAWREQAKVVRGAGRVQRLLRSRALFSARRRGPRAPARRPGLARLLRGAGGPAAAGTQLRRRGVSSARSPCARRTAEARPRRADRFAIAS